MQPEETIEIGSIGSEYLKSIQSLSEELACAADAIARNDVKALEKHIEVQQTLCAHLLSLDRFRQLLHADHATWNTISDALRTLNRNNQIYSKLLAASGQSHRVLLTLCKTYVDSSSHVAERTPVVRALSCEV
jgi:hypothetical protein